MTPCLSRFFSSKAANIQLLFCKQSSLFSSVFLGVVPLDLKTVYQRIKDNVDVLCNFSAKREPGRDRIEYLSLLKKDLCTYYSYNNFLIEKLMDLFPLSEVCFRLYSKGNMAKAMCQELVVLSAAQKKSIFFSCLQLIDFLEANEIHRPVTIRTNTLKTRRRDLAQVTARALDMDSVNNKSMFTCRCLAHYK